MSLAPSLIPALAPLTQRLRNSEPGILPAAIAVVTEAELALPVSKAQASVAAPGAGADDAAALRPDQLFMASRMGYPALDGRALASSWRAMVRTYGEQQARRDLQASAGAMPPLQLAAGQQGQVVNLPQAHHLLAADAWRFTVHAGSALAHHLEVVAEKEDAAPGRRKRARYGLRLELSLPDGTRVVVQVEPVPGGIALELCAQGAAPLERLRALQPALEQAVARTGLQVVRWRFRDSLPPGNVHATMVAGDASSALSLPVFRALAELALVLPAVDETST
ncbi:hypothetical protein [Massilia sp. H6]|uniref:hypothetical protein n=1 Tax=Massilia sp. H6 TaxID=2970464 RepID=UPI0021671A75|nr:hypothetical protein [Massilia sp. H6]UVW29732.1 hypothetical protein NRS07_06285 [Massilia sp. H6]